jgi:hypothetical protein
LGGYHKVFPIEAIAPEMLEEEDENGITSPRIVKTDKTTIKSGVLFTPNIAAKATAYYMKFMQSSLMPGMN